ncbi:MAG TPA: hypothetical protein VFV43_00615 [Limnobacter sp.]|nr:hypothetical protein [Limnobacter sp.]
MYKQFSFCLLGFALFVAACDKHHSQSISPEKGQVTTPSDRTDNWLFGQWTIDYGEGFAPAQGCQRPDGEFGRHHVYWRHYADGDPFEELNKVDGYLIEGNLIKVRVVSPTSFEPMIFEDGTMHFELQPEGWMKFFFPKSEDEFLKMVKCESSPFPYSADVAPTPPKYEGIEPGIVDRPRDGT